MLKPHQVSYLSVNILDGSRIKPWILIVVLLDLRVVVGFCGVLLSILSHELYHIVTHWREIQGINIFPDRGTIMEVVFMPSVNYDLALEEAIAYTITMTVLLFTVMLICEIHDMRDSKSVSQTILLKRYGESAEVEDERAAIDRLGVILGINPTA